MQMVTIKMAIAIHSHLRAAAAVAAQAEKLVPFCGHYISAWSIFYIRIRFFLLALHKRQYVSHSDRTLTFASSIFITSHTLFRLISCVSTLAISFNFKIVNSLLQFGKAWATESVRNGWCERECAPCKENNAFVHFAYIEETFYVICACAWIHGFSVVLFFVLPLCRMCLICNWQCHTYL